MDIRPLLRKDDLKTPLVIPKERLEDLKRERAAAFLRDTQIYLPIAYITVKVSCTFKKIDSVSAEHICSTSKKVDAYDDADSDSDKVETNVLRSEKFVGRSTMIGSGVPLESIDDLLIFNEEDGWILVERANRPRENRFVWIRKDEVPYKITPIKLGD